MPTCCRTDRVITFLAGQNAGAEREHRRLICSIRYARIRAFFARRSKFRALATANVSLVTDEELALAKPSAEFRVCSGNGGRRIPPPNYLCNYLYELSGYFARFMKLVRCSRPNLPFAQPACFCVT